MSPALRVWLVDDDASIRWVLERALRNDGMAPRAFEAAEPALAALRRESPDVLITDIRMPGASGLELLRLIRDARPQLPVIVMTAHSDLGSAVSAYEGGAFEYLPKPFDIDKAVALVRRAANGAPNAGADAARGGAHSGAARAARRRCSRCSAPSAAWHAPRHGAHHRASPAPARNWWRAPCTSTARGPASPSSRSTPRRSRRTCWSRSCSGTSAAPSPAPTRSGAGRFEQADGGTLFLDEIGDMSLPLQTRLLRVLAEGEFYRVGGQTPIRVDVRVIAATHQQLAERAGARPVPRGPATTASTSSASSCRRCGRAREDIPDLLRHYMLVAAAELGVEPKALAPEALARLAAHDWPGNVRELVNLCRRLSVLAPGSVVHLADLPPELVHAAGSADAADWAAALTAWAERHSQAPAQPLLTTAQPQFERALIRVALKRTQGHRQEAARLLGWGRNTLTRKLKELGMNEAAADE